MITVRVHICYIFRGSQHYTAVQINILRNDDDLCEYILSVAYEKIEEMHNAPSYKQMKYSKSSFSSLCDITKITLKVYIQNTIDLLENDKLSLAYHGVDCFRRCLTTADYLYKRKFAEFLRLIGN